MQQIHTDLQLRRTLESLESWGYSSLTKCCQLPLEIHPSHWDLYSLKVALRHFDLDGFFRSCLCACVFLVLVKFS